jgi:hypothetical protein
MLRIIVLRGFHISFQNMSLRNLYDQFCHCLSTHQEFWDIVEEIDKKTWVLEPDVPRPDIISRRIALGRKLNLNKPSVECIYMCGCLGKPVGSRWALF